MIIPVNSQYRVTRDEYQWIIEVHTPRNDQSRKQWQARTYHANLKQAMEKLVKLGIANRDMMTLAEFDRLLSDLLRTLEQAIERASVLSILTTPRLHGVRELED